MQLLTFDEFKNQKINENLEQKIKVSDYIEKHLRPDIKHMPDKMHQQKMIKAFINKVQNSNSFGFKPDDDEILNQTLSMKELIFHQNQLSLMKKKDWDEID